MRPFLLLSSLSLLTSVIAQSDEIDFSSDANYFTSPTDETNFDEWRIGTIQTLEWTTAWDNDINFVMWPLSGQTPNGDGAFLGANVRNTGRYQFRIGENLNLRGRWRISGHGQDPNGGDLRGAIINSTAFSLPVDDQTSATVTVTATPSETPELETPAPSTTPEPTETSADALSASGTTEPSIVDSGSDRGMRVGLGVGLGIGIPLIAAAVVALVLYRRRTSKYHDPEKRNKLGTEVAWSEDVSH